MSALMGRLAADLVWLIALSAIVFGFFRAGSVGLDQGIAWLWLLVGVFGTSLLSLLSAIGGKYQAQHGLNLRGKPIVDSKSPT